MIKKLIVAYDLNRCIGKDGKLPWHIPADLKWFRDMTTGHPVIMGRKTWESLRVRPLPNRFNIVLSEQNETIKRIEANFNDVAVFSDVFNAIEYCKRKQKTSEVWIIGGAHLYQTALNNNLVDEVYVNEIQHIHDGDTYFPRLPVTYNSTWEVQILHTETNSRILKFVKQCRS